MLVLLVGSDLIQQTVDRWFNVDVERILSSSQALGTALRESVTERTRMDARAIAREVENQRLLGEEGTGRLRRLVERRARERHLDLVTVLTREGELLAVMDPRLPASGDPAPGEALAEAALLGREAETTAPFGAGELVRVAAPVKDAAGQGHRGRGGVDPLAGGRGRRGPRGPGELRQVSQGPDLSGAHQGRLPVALPLPGPAHPLRRGVAVALPGPPDHHALAPGGRGSRADRRRRARGEGRFPVGQRRVRGAHRFLQPHVRAPGAQRRRGRVQPHQPDPQEPGAGGAAATHGDRARDRGHRRGGGRPRGNPDRDQRRRLPAAGDRRLRGRAAGGAGPGRPRPRRDPGDRRAPSLRAGGPPGARGAGPVAGPLPASGRDRRAPARAPRLAARGGARARRPHPADARAEGRGLGRGGAQARARDQEPAHPHPALGPEDPQGLHQVGPGLRDDPHRVQRGHRQGGRRPQGPRGRVRGVRAPARGQPGPDLAPRGHRGGLVPLRRPLRRGADRAAARGATFPSCASTRDR